MPYLTLNAAGAAICLGAAAWFLNSAASPDRAYFAMGIGLVSGIWMVASLSGMLVYWIVTGLAGAPF